MKMSRKGQLVALIIGVLLLLALLCFKVRDTTLPLINVLKEKSTDVVAFFTCVYAVITYFQFGVMNKQLNEMKLERFLQNQPVLSVDKNINFTVKKPHLYSNPPEQTFDYATRCCIDYQVGNFSTNSAICVDMITNLIFQDGTELKSRADRIGVLNASQSFSTTLIYPDLKTGGQDVRILNALIEGGLTLHVAILYRTIMGGYFTAKSSYKIMPKSQTVVDALQEWAVSMKDATSKIEKSEQMSFSERLSKNLDLKNELDAAARDFKLDFYIEAISKEYSITNMTSEEYERKLTDFSVSAVPIPSSHVKMIRMDGTVESS